MFKVGDRVVSIYFYLNGKKLKGKIIKISILSNNAHNYGIIWDEVFESEFSTKNIYWNKGVDLLPDFEYNNVLKDML